LAQSHGPRAARALGLRAIGAYPGGLHTDLTATARNAPPKPFVPSCTLWFGRYQRPAHQRGAPAPWGRFGRAPWLVARAQPL